MTPLCRAEDSLLLVIDIQERLAGAMPAHVRHNVTTRTAFLQQAASILDIPVIHTEQYPQGLGNTVSELDLGPGLHCTTIEKTGFSCCRADAFTQAVRESRKRQIIIAGMETHVCILQTALELHRDGVEVYIAEDAVCSRSKMYHRNALRRMQNSGVIISNSESVVFEWLRDAGHPDFRQISGLLKQL